MGVSLAGCFPLANLEGNYKKVSDAASQPTPLLPLPAKERCHLYCESKRPGGGIHEAHGAHGHAT